MTINTLLQERSGRPGSASDSTNPLSNRASIGFDEEMDFINGAAALGYHFVRDNFALRTDHLLTQINLMRAGAGIAGTHVRLAERWPELVRVLQWVPLPALEFWCVAHSDVQYNSRIREVMQFLIQWFSNNPYREVLL